MMKVNIIDIMNLGVRTVPIQSYTSGMTFTEGISQKVGVLDANHLLESKVCKTQQDRVDHVEELKELFGTNANIVVIETPANSLAYVVNVKTDKVESSPAINENDEEVINDITQKVSERYSIVQKEIILFFGRDEQGLYITDVS